MSVLGIDAGATGQPSLKSYIERLDASVSRHQASTTIRGGRGKSERLTAKGRATELKATYGEATVAAVLAAASVSNADDVGHPHPLTLWGVKSLLMTGVQIFFLSKKAEKKKLSRGAVGIQKMEGRRVRG